MDDVLHHCRVWLNEHIALSNVGEEKVSMRDMYRYVSVLLLSHLTGLSFERTIAWLTEMNCNAPSLDRTRFISQNIKAFSATNRGNSGETTWMSQRDRTQQLSALERASFRAICKVFLNPVYTFTTLDDDLYGTRAKENQVKSLSARKADKEGHSADAIADALFRLTFMVRFRRRGMYSSLCNVYWKTKGNVVFMVSYSQLTEGTEVCPSCDFSCRMVLDQFLLCQSTSLDAIRS